MGFHFHGLLLTCSLFASRGSFCGNFSFMRRPQSFPSSAAFSANLGTGSAVEPHVINHAQAPSESPITHLNSDSKT